MPKSEQIESKQFSSIRPILRLRANQIIRHVQARQFPTQGRKARVQGERMVRLLRALVRFDATGTGECLYPSVTSILKVVRERDSRYDKPMSWSRRTVLRYLAKLRSAGIEQANGGKRWRSGQWTRRRILHCSKILPLPVPESGTFERSNLAHKKSKAFASHNTHRDEPSFAKTAKGASIPPYKQKPLKTKANPYLPPYRVSELGKLCHALPILNALTARYDEETAWSGLFWSMRATGNDPQRERYVTNPRAYAVACVDSLFESFDDCQVQAMLERVTPDLERQPVWFDGQTWREKAA